MKDQISAGIDDFEAVRQTLTKSLLFEKTQTEKRLRSVRTTVIIHSILAHLLILSYGIIAYTPLISDIFIAWVSLYFADTNLLTFNLFWPLRVIFIALWCILIAFPAGLLINNKTNSILLAIFTSVLLPLYGIGLPFVLISQTGSLFHAVVVREYIISILFLLFLFATMFGFLNIISGSIPLIVFLVVTSLKSGKSGLVFPTYEEILRSSLQKLRDQTKEFIPERIAAINTISKAKFEGTSVRLEAFSLALSSLGLLGILTLVVSSSQINEFLNNALSFISRFLAFNNENVAIPGYVPAVVILFFLILAGFQYFTSTYNEMRLLEMINIFCNLSIASPQETKNRVDYSISNQKLLSHETKPEISFKVLLFGVIIVLLDLLRNQKKDN